MAHSDKENRRVTRRDFFKLFFAGIYTAYELNKSGGRLANRLAQGGAYAEYPQVTVDFFENEANKITDFFSRLANNLGVRPPTPSNEVYRRPQIEKSASIIDSLSPNSFMIFIPGATSEELGSWVEEFVHPWMTAFETLRSGKPKDQADAQIASYIKSLDIYQQMKSSSQDRRLANFKTMIPARTPIFPWEFVTGGRKQNGEIRPEHPEVMAAFLAGYMRWILRENPTAEFVLLGHSLGANTLHCFLRLMQGGIYKDLSSHIPHAILYSQGVNDLSNEVVYNIAHSRDNIADMISSPSNINTDTGVDNLRNQLALVLNSACRPDYFSGLDPVFLKNKFKTQITSVFSPDDPVSCGVTKAEAVILHWGLGTKPYVDSITRGTVPEPDGLIKVPGINDLIRMFATLHSPTHQLNSAAIKPIFGV